MSMSAAARTTWRFNQRAVSVSFCCNNPDNGLFNGKFCSVEIGDEILKLDNQFWPPKEPALRFELDPNSEVSGNGFGPAQVRGRVKVSRRFFPIIGYKYGWGNWCWDLVMMLPEDVIDLVNYLKSLNCFQPEVGETRWFNYFTLEGAVFDRNDQSGWIRMLEKWGYQKP